MQVVRWRRAGEDRLYVRLDDGTIVGWVDLTTGKDTCLRDELRDEFDETIGGPVRRSSTAGT